MLELFDLADLGLPRLLRRLYRQLLTHRWVCGMLLYGVGGSTP
jgi:hypothetical protein